MLPEDLISNILPHTLFQLLRLPPDSRDSYTDQQLAVIVSALQ